jgi:hypothetical protein
MRTPTTRCAQKPRQRLADKQKLEFPIVRDVGLGIARAFGLAFTLPDDLKATYQGFGIDLRPGLDCVAGSTGWLSWAPRGGECGPSKGR